MQINSKGKRKVAAGVMSTLELVDILAVFKWTKLRAFVIGTIWNRIHWIACRLISFKEALKLWSSTQMKKTWCAHEFTRII